MRRRILVVPEIRDLGSFSRLIAHIGHYFSHVDAERIAVLVESSVLREAEEWLRSPSLPPGFGDRVLHRVEAVRDTINLYPWPRDIGSLAMGSELVLDWDDRASEMDPWPSVKKGFRPNRTLVALDWSTRPGVAWVAEAARVMVQGRQFDARQGEELRNLGAVLGSAKHAYLIGPGLSARRALDRDLSDGVRIACSTVILDDELMDHVRPQIVTLDDPIHHFGPSAHAQRYQQAVATQARMHDFTVVTTEPFAPLMRAYVPEVAERVIGLRQGSAGWPDNFDLLANPAVRPYDNVLTMLMLPLGATFSRSISLVGFDGRDRSGGLVLRHGSAAMLDEELEDIRLVHPGLVDLDDPHHLADHAATVERQLAELEEAGVEIRPMAASDIPALRRRTMPGTMARPRTSPESRSVLVSLTPDWIDDFGHFGPFERRVHEAAEAAGCLHIALASAGLEPSADWHVPTFSEATYTASSVKQFAPVGQRFEGELRAALDNLRLDAGSTVFLYTGDVWHLAAVLAVAANHREHRFVVNLMRSHGWIARALDDPDPWIEALVDLLRSCLEVAIGTNVEVTVDTKAIAQDVESLTGRDVSVWPMIAVSAPWQRGAHRKATDGVPHIVAPVHAQGGSGFADLVGLAERVSTRLKRGELRLTARWPAAGKGPAMVRLARRIEEQGGHLVRDNMTDDEYAEFIAEADVALIPYPVRPFRTRTSSVAVDALLAGKPVVAVRGTWAGDLVERYGAGLTYAEGDVAELEDALGDVIGHIDAYVLRVAESRSTFESEHAPGRLIEFLRDGAGLTRPEPQVPTDVEAIIERTGLMRGLFRWHADSHTSNRLAVAIGDDERQRVAEAFRDEAERHRRAIAYRESVIAAADAGSRPA